jgi:hypothetical protein
MKTTPISSRITSLSAAAFMTLAMLLSVNTLATNNAPAHQQMAAGQSTAQQG